MSNIKSGTSENFIDRLIAYVDEFDSCWKKKIIPASNCQIDEIYNLSCLRDEGLDLPKSYIQYLVNMGEDDGGLLFDNLHCASTSLSMIIKNYQEVIGYEEVDEDCDDFTNPYKFVFAYNEECSCGYYIETLNNGKQVISDYEDRSYGREYLSENFEKLVFQSAYYKYNHKKYRCSIAFTIANKEIELLNEFEKIFSDLGYTKLWISDKSQYIGETQKSSVILKKGYHFYGQISCDSEYEIMNLVKKIEKIAIIEEKSLRELN